MKIKIIKNLDEKKKKRKKKKKKKRTPRAAYWWGYGGNYGDYGDAGGDGGGGDGKRDDTKVIRVKIVKNLKEKKDPVSKEISKLMKKGMKQDQAVAIALSMDEKGKLKERCQKGYKTHPTRKTKKMFGKTYRNCVKAEEAKEPAKGTGKKPKGSSRRLYTDEDPSDTVSVKFSTVQDIKDTLSKQSFKSKSHKRQSQIINLIHQRVRTAYKNAKDPKVKARLKKAFDYAEDRKEASKKKTIRMRKEKK